MPRGKVLLLGADENPALPILESLTRAGLAVDVASHRRVSVGFFSRHARRRFRCPPPSAEGAFVEALLARVRGASYDAVFAAGEDPTYLLAKHRPAVEPHARVPLPDLPVFLLCRDKTLTMREAARLGVATPRTFEPERDGVDAIVAALPFPVVVKPNVSDGARGLSFPASRDDLVRTLERTRREYGPCHVQEFIPQTGLQYKAEVLLGRGGETIAACVYSKIRYYPPTGGSSTLNRTVDRPDIVERAVRMLRGIGWTGLGDCDFIEDPRDGTPKLMEINPRFTRSIKICLRAGVDFPLLLYRFVMGESPPPVLAYRIGTMLRYLPADVAWFLRSPDRRRADPGFFRTFLAAPCDEVFSLSDPGPGLAYLLAGALDLLDPRARRFRLRAGSGRDGGSLAA